MWEGIALRAGVRTFVDGRTRRYSIYGSGMVSWAIYGKRLLLQTLRILAHRSFSYLIRTGFKIYNDFKLFESQPRVSAFTDQL